MQGEDYLVFTNKELIATKTCGPAQEEIQITKGTTILVSARCKVRLQDHHIFGEESLKLSSMETKIFDWRWDACSSEYQRV